MNVCELNECDFLETRFKEYSSSHEFFEDGTFTTTANGKIEEFIYIFRRKVCHTTNIQNFI